MAYNHCPVRDRQAQTRVKKGLNYRPTGIRASHHNPPADTAKPKED